MSENIKINISESQVKKICGNRVNAETILGNIGVSFDKKNSSKEIYNLLIENWDYEKILPVVRNIFRTTEKYKNGKNALEFITQIKLLWNEKNLGEFKWPCSQGQWEAHAQLINTSKKTLIDKVNQTEKDSVKYGLMKSYTTNRNDYIEFLMFEINYNILPTLSHSRGVDFFIDGEEYDQKVAKSPTEKFKKENGQNWFEIAKNNPQLVAKYLYEGQDEERFDSKKRLYVVSLTDEIDYKKLKQTIEKMDFSKPHRVSFDYKHKNGGTKTYETSCFVILTYI